MMTSQFTNSNELDSCPRLAEIAPVRAPMDGWDLICYHVHAEKWKIIAINNAVGENLFIRLSNFHVQDVVPRNS